MARNHEVRIKFGKDEFERVERKAISLGLTLSAFIRMIAIKSEVTID